MPDDLTPAERYRTGDAWLQRAIVSDGEGWHAQAVAEAAIAQAHFLAALAATKGLDHAD